MFKVRNLSVPLKNVCDILGREFAGLLQHQSGHGAQPPAEGEGRQEEVEEVIPHHPPPSFCSSKPSSIKIVSVLICTDDSAFIIHLKLVKTCQFTQDLCAN